MFIFLWLVPAAALAAAETALPPFEPPTNAPGSAAGTFDPSAIFESARPAVIILRPVNARGQGNTKGTGFLISSNGIVVTARHVAAANQEMFALTSDNIKHPVTGYLGEDADHDLAVVKIDGDGFPHLALGPRDLPKPGQWVALVGNPGGGGFAFPTGQVAGVAGVQDVWEDILTTIPVRGGHSGSPLLNDRGEVIGLAVAATDLQRGVAMPAKVIHRILDRAGTNAPTPYEKRPRMGQIQPVGLDKDFRAARQAMAQADWATAEQRLNRVLQRFPSSPAALFFLGYTQTQRKASKDALATFERALRFREESPVLWFFYGVSLVMNGKSTEGVAALNKAIRMNLADRSQLAAAWSTLAVEAAKLGHAAEAREAFEQVRRVDAPRAVPLQTELLRLCPQFNTPPDSPPLR